MKSVKSVLAFSAVAMIADPAMAQFGAGPAELDLVRVTDNIYVIHNALVPGNVTVLVTDEGALVVDTKYAIDYDNVAAMIAGFTDQPIRYVINTHYHDDHSGANRNFQLTGATVISSANARQTMLANQRTEGLPDMTFNELARIHIGGETVVLHYFGRAHTDGDILAHFIDQGVLAAGDTYANDPGTPELVDHSGGGSARAWPQTLTRALELDFDTVVPGHGHVATREELVDFRDSAVRLAETVEAMQEQGRSRDDIEAVLRNEFNFGDFHVQMSLDGLLEELR